jgi:hypothetical protein
MTSKTFSCWMYSISILIKDGHASPKSFNQRKDLYRNSNAISALPVWRRNRLGWKILLGG